VTNLEAEGWAVVRFYKEREAAEQWINEVQHAVNMTSLSYR
jgi:uncharacterized protein YbdZ (MbtH family)